MNKKDRTNANGVEHAQLNHDNKTSKCIKLIVTEILIKNEKIHCAALQTVPELKDLKINPQSSLKFDIYNVLSPWIFLDHLFCHVTSHCLSSDFLLTTYILITSLILDKNCILSQCHEIFPQI